MRSRTTSRKLTPACFEPTIDYVVVEDPALAVREVPGRRAGAGDADEVGRRGDGDRAHVQAGAGQGHSRPGDGQGVGAETCLTTRLIPKRLITPNPDRLGYIRFAFERGYTVEQIHEMTAIDPWFLQQVCEVVELEQRLEGSYAGVDRRKDSC